MLATASQPEPSANAPCTRTTFLICCFTTMLLCGKDPTWEKITLGFGCRSISGPNAQCWETSSTLECCWPVFLRKVAGFVVVGRGKEWHSAVEDPGCGDLTTLQGRTKRC